MSEVRTKPISYRAVELVLNIMEMPNMGISATALDEYHSEAGAELLAWGALEPDDFEPVAQRRRLRGDRRIGQQNASRRRP